jgi:hypothetical protein
MVPKKGLEPPHPCGYMDLNHARLPIPPLRQVTALRDGQRRLDGRDYPIYSTEAARGVKPLLQCETVCDRLHASRPSLRLEASAQTATPKQTPQTRTSCNCGRWRMT